MAVQTPCYAIKQKLKDRALQLKAKEGLLQPETQVAMAILPITGKWHGSGSRPKAQRLPITSGRLGKETGGDVKLCCALPASLTPSVSGRVWRSSRFESPLRKLKQQGIPMALLGNLRSLLLKSKGRQARFWRLAGCCFYYAPASSDHLSHSSHQGKK